MKNQLLFQEKLILEITANENKNKARNRLETGDYILYADYLLKEKTKNWNCETYICQLCRTHE